MKRLLIIVVLLLSVSSAWGQTITGPAQLDTTVPGGTGRETYSAGGFTQSLNGSGSTAYYLFEPTSATGSRPVVLFIHGLGGTNPGSYAGIIRHLVYQGIIVVFPEWGSSASSVSANSITAMENAKTHLDAGGHKTPDWTKFAVIGHSMGGMAAAVVASTINAGGTTLPTPQAVMCVSPYSGVPHTNLASMNSGTLLLSIRAQNESPFTTYINTGWNDVYNQTTAVPLANKNKIYINSDTHGNPSSNDLSATHNTINSYTSDYSDFDNGDYTINTTTAVINALDYYGIWKWADGLLDAAWSWNVANRDYAIHGTGTGSSNHQTYMGLWSDDQAVNTPTVTDETPTTTTSSTTTSTSGSTSVSTSSSSSTSTELTTSSSSSTSSTTTSVSATIDYTNLTPITSDPLTGGGSCDWNSTVNKIIYDRVTRIDGSNYFTIYSMDRTGANQETVIGIRSETTPYPDTYLLPAGNLGNPAWTPDGQYYVIQAENNCIKALGDNYDAQTIPGKGYGCDLYLVEYNPYTNFSTKAWRLWGVSCGPVTGCTSCSDIKTDTSTTHWGALIQPVFNRAGTKLAWGERVSSNCSSSGCPTAANRNKWVIQYANYTAPAGTSSPVLDTIQSIVPYDATNTTRLGIQMIEPGNFCVADNHLVFSALSANSPSQAPWQVYILDLSTLTLISDPTSCDAAYTYYKGACTAITDAGTYGTWNEHAHFSPTGDKIRFISAQIDGTMYITSGYFHSELWQFDCNSTTDHTIKSATQLTHHHTPGYVEYYAPVTAVECGPADNTWISDYTSAVEYIVDNSWGTLEGSANGHAKAFVEEITYPAGSDTSTTSSVTISSSSSSTSTSIFSVDTTSTTTAVTSVASISGYATDQSSNSIEGCRINLYCSACGKLTLVYSVLTDANGYYSFKNLDDSKTYTVRAVKARYTFTPSSYYNVTANGSTVNFSGVYH